MESENVILIPVFISKALSNQLLRDFFIKNFRENNTEAEGLETSYSSCIKIQHYFTDTTRM